MSSLVPETGWAQGASGAENVYDTSPAGLGLSPSYLASSSATATSSTTTSGTVFPTTPTDGNIFVYTADAVNRIRWTFIYNSTAATYKWEFIGGPPLFVEVTAIEARANAAYGALATAGPAILLPFAGDYDVAIGFHGGNVAASEAGLMSYDIGGTGALDADAVEVTSTAASALYDYTAVARPRRKTGLTAVTLTAKYRTGGGSATFKHRWMSVSPSRVTG